MCSLPGHTSVGRRKWRISAKKILQDSPASAKKFEVKITGTRSFDQAQVCAGGVSLEEIDPLTMESLKCPGLYITGELLDVDGMCGGYNLQWAWATGHIAGEAAAL